VTDRHHPGSTGIGSVRWLVCALVFFATTINYIDRQVLGILAPELEETIGWSDVEYGYIVTAFQAAYAIGLLVIGKVIDIVGTRHGYAIVLGAWSLAAMSHAFARTPFDFGVARFALGLAEAGNFPAAVKTVAEWFPRRERAFATGIFNAGSNVGAIVGPAIVPFIALRYSWQHAFIVTGAIGSVWLVAWYAWYQSPHHHPRVSARELAHIGSDAEPDSPNRIHWRQLIGFRQMWAIGIGKFMTDPIWWFYLYWVPKFLADEHGLRLATLGPPLIVIYLVADIGSVGGGWLSSMLIARGFTVNAARKSTMLLCALCVTPIVFASGTSNLWTAVALISLATAAHQAWSANMFTLASDMFPRNGVGQAVGMAGMAGSIGGMLVATATGWLLTLTGSYLAIFAVASSAYLIALGIIHGLAPTLAPVTWPPPDPAIGSIRVDE